MNAVDLATSLQLFGPELILVLGLVVLFLTDSFAPSTRSNFAPMIITVVTCLLATAWTYKNAGVGSQALFSGLISNDRFTSFFRYIFFFTCAAGVYLAFGSKELGRRHRMEFTLLVVSVTFGMSLMASATHMLMLYIGIETVSILSFVLAGFNREDLKANEASFKYLIFGALASGLMIYGMSIVYGYAGSLQYAEIAKFLQAQNGSFPFYFLFASALIYLGFAYKISSFPMHFWTPDVYEGAPTPVVTFFSIGPKAAGFAALIRFLIEVCAVQTAADGTWTWASIAGFGWVPWIAVLAALTMTVGNLCALGQTNVKRLLAYSSIAHVGYMMMGLVSYDTNGLSAILFYLIAYCAMNVGAFWVVSVVRDVKGHDNLEAFTGLGWQMPVLGTCMAIFLFSLTGIPMFSGFIGKFLIFGAVVKTEGMLWLAVVGVLNSVVSLYYYSKILKALWLERPESEGEIKLPLYHGWALVGLAIPTIVWGLFFAPIIEFTNFSMILGGL